MTQHQSSTRRRIGGAISGTGNDIENARGPFTSIQKGKSGTANGKYFYTVAGKYYYKVSGKEVKPVEKPGKHTTTHDGPGPVL